MLKWYGDKVKEKMDRVIPWALNSIMADCIKGAKARVPVKTATLQGSIRMEFAKLINGMWTGIWGSFNVLYALFVELGTPRAQAKPYLRPAADANYGRLSKKIKEGMSKK